MTRHLSHSPWQNRREVDRSDDGDVEAGCKRLVAAIFQDVANDIQHGTRRGLDFIRYAGTGEPGDFIFWCSLANNALGTNIGPKVVAERLIRTNWPYPDGIRHWIDWEGVKHQESVMSTDDAVVYVLN